MTMIVPATKRHTCSATLQKGSATGADARITISTIDEDREGDVLVPEGAVLGPYKRNPVVMFGHDHWGLPIGKTINITVTAGRSMDAEFAFLKGDPFADRVRNAFDQGVLNGASVGFRPLEYEPNGSRGFRFTKWELLEWSLVPVPANASAVKILKRFGLDMPTSAAQLNATLNVLTTELKSGRVLSSVNEERLRRASGLLGEILDQLEADDEDEDDDKGIAVVVDGSEPMLITDDALRTAVATFVAEELQNTTGKLMDAGDLLPKRFTQADEPVIEMSEEDLTKLITEIFAQSLREGINTLTGRVD